MVVGACRTGLSVSRTATLLGFSTQFPVGIKNGPPPKGHPANLTQLWEALESTWASSPVECFRHPVVHARVIETVAKGVQLNIRMVFLMFCTLSVWLAKLWLRSIESYIIRVHDPEILCMTD